MTTSYTHVEIIFVWIIENFDQFDDVRVIEFLEDRNLAINAFQWVLYV